MEKKKIRLLSIVLALMLVLGAIPVTANAEIGTPEEGDIFGDITFTTFEDLKELAARDYSQYLTACYKGTEPLVIESDLTLPHQLSLSLLNKQLYIPTGISFEVSSLDASELIVDGTLTCWGCTVYGVLDVSGTLVCTINGIQASDTIVNGFENIVFHSDDAVMEMSYSIRTMEDLNEAISTVENNQNSRISYSLAILPDIDMNTGLLVSDCFIIDESVSIPESCYFSVNHPIVITEDSTLEILGEYSENDYRINFYEPVTVNGTLNNHARITIGYIEGGSLTIADCGTYTGNGGFSIRNTEVRLPIEALAGINLDNYEITEVNAMPKWMIWNLKYIGQSGTDPAPTEPPVTEPPVTEPVLPTLTGTYTTDLIMPAADLGVSAPDSVLRATLTFGEDGTASCTWEAVDLTAFRIFFHDMFVNAYYAMAYGAGITDLAEIEQFCIDSTGLSVSDYMDTLVTDQAMIESFTPASTSGTYSYNADHSAILTDLAIMDVSSDPTIENSFVLGGGTLYLTAASWGKPDYTFVCTAQ